MTTTDQAGRLASPATRLADMAGAIRLARELIGHDHWTAEEVAAHQRRRLQELIGHAVARSPFYRERYAGLGPGCRAGCGWRRSPPPGPCT